MTPFLSPESASAMRGSVVNTSAIPPLSRELNAVKISLGISGTGSGAAGNPLDRSAGDAPVLFDTTVGGQPVALLETTAEEIGVPLNLTQARKVQSRDDAFHLPDHILAALGAVVPEDGPPLWLSFPSPSGYLAALPWESMLRPRMAAAVMRLSFTEVQPVTSRETRDILLCFTGARSGSTSVIVPPNQVLEYFLENVPDNIARYTTFHIFGDSTLWPAITSLLPRFQKRYKIKIYDPHEAQRLCDRDSGPAKSEPLDNSWLQWMRNALGSTSVDVAHFVGEGYLGREEGFLAFSESQVPTDDEMTARFVGARQICTFLGHVGAWSAAFSSPPGNYSVLGLRLLQDRIAHFRPGPVLFHDMTQDQNRQGLNEAYQFAYAIEEAVSPKSPAVSLYCHPEWAMPWAERDPACQRLLGELTLAGSLSDVLEGSENTPSWLASGQRSLENSLAQLVSSYPGEPEKALMSGAAEALRFTARLLERHARALRSDAGTEIK